MSIIDMIDMFANSKKQQLSKHSYAVARLAVELFELIGIKENALTKPGIDGIENFKRQIFLAGLLHDLGKLDENFQYFLNKKQTTEIKDPEVINGVHIEASEKSNFSFLKYPRHNEVSWALFQSIFDWTTSNESKELRRLERNISYGIYFHHENILRDDDFSCSKILAELHQSENPDNDVKSLNNLHILDKIRNYLNDLSLITANDIFCPSTHKKDIVTLKSILTDFQTYKENRKVNISPPKFLFDEICSTPPTSPNLKDFKVEIEAKKLLLRSLVVSADRIISGLSIQDLNEMINESTYQAYAKKELKEEDVFNQFSKLNAGIDKMIETFRERNEFSEINQERDEQQKNAAQQLSKIEAPASLFGPAGCGKTKIFLQWCKYVLSHPKSSQATKKLIIIAPRKTVCWGLYDEIRLDYLPELSIELILGDNKKRSNNGVEVDLNNESKFFRSDVTITTIDQITSIMMSHKKINVLLDILDSVVVFDEFHEFFDIPGMVLLFKAIIYLKSLLSHSQTLLVSATPNYYFLKEVLNISENSVVRVSTFNDQDFQIDFLPYEVKKADGGGFLPAPNPLNAPQKNGTLVVFNTAIDSQRSSLEMSRSQKESVINFHSRLTYEDKEVILKKIFKNWGKNSISSEYVLRSGPIVQASLNISSNHLMTEPCSAENWCQRLGRVNRFGEKEKLGLMETAFPDYFLSESSGFGNHSTIGFLKRISSENQAFSWIQYAQRHLQTPIKLKEIYKIYFNYHNEKKTKDAYEKDFLEILKASLKAFNNNDFTPYLYPKKMKKKETLSLSLNSLRGSSVFVLPIDFNEESNQSQWLYVPNQTTTTSKTITLAKEEMQSASSLLTYHEKYVNVIKTSLPCYPASYKSKYISFKILKEARMVSTPVIVSFPPDTSSTKNLNCPESLVYLRRNNVVIGLFKMDLSTVGNIKFTQPIIPLDTPSKNKKKN